MEFRKIVMMTLYVRQQRRHRCKEQTFGLCGRRKGWDDFRQYLGNMYIIIYDIWYIYEIDIIYYIHEIDIYHILYIYEIDIYHIWNRSPNQVRCVKQGTQSQCTGMTQRDGMGREVGRGFRIGDTCIPMADSCQHMAKTTTIL